jgi:hypothetical protein
VELFFAALFRQAFNVESEMTMHRKLEILTNVAIVACCALLAATLVRYFWVTPSPSRNIRPNQIRAGDIVSLPGVDWSMNHKTLLLVLQTNCHFCTDSAPFYKRLSETLATRSGLQMMAVFPQPIEVSSQYLSQLEVPIRKVMQVSFADLKVAGTPTVLLVGPSGRVERVWFGKLSKQDEDMLLSLN